MSVTKLPGAIAPEAKRPGNSASAPRCRKTEDVISLSGYRTKLAQEARTAWLATASRKIKSVPSDYVWLAAFFAGCLYLSRSYEAFFTSTLIFNYGVLALFFIVLAWAYHRLFLRLFFLMNGTLIAVILAGLFIPQITELAWVFGLVIATNIALHFTGWLR